jgi:Protein of unknown function (DUF2591)
MTKVSELTGAALDWAVSLCEGRTWVASTHFLSYHMDEGSEWHFSTDWAQGGPIIEETCASVFFDIKDASYEGHPDEPWFSEMDDIGGMWHGPTPLIAAMRCYVANKLGNEVEIPEELL